MSLPTSTSAADDILVGCTYRTRYTIAKLRTTPGIWRAYAMLRDGTVLRVHFDSWAEAAAWCAAHHRAQP